MTAPNGGSLAGLMAAGDTLVDNWVAHAKEHTASSPELVAHLMISMEEVPNKVGTLAVMFATAVQRLAAHER